MRLLEADPALSQRQLAAALGISLGRTNHCLKALIEKGLVKVGNFRRSTRKLGYLYLLTPQGLEQKARLAARFLARKEAEHAALVREIEELRQEVAQRHDVSPILKALPGVLEPPT